MDLLNNMMSNYQMLITTTVTQRPDGMLITVSSPSQLYHSVLVPRGQLESQHVSVTPIPTLPVDKIVKDYSLTSFEALSLENLEYLMNLYETKSLLQLSDIYESMENMINGGLMLEEQWRITFQKYDDHKSNDLSDFVPNLARHFASVLYLANRICKGSDGGKILLHRRCLVQEYIVGLFKDRIVHLKAKLARGKKIEKIVARHEEEQRRNFELKMTEVAEEHKKSKEQMEGKIRDLEYELDFSKYVINLQRSCFEKPNPAL